MSDPFIIKTLISICGGLMLLGIKILMGIANNVKDIDRKLPVLAEKVQSLEKKTDKQSDQIEQLNKAIL
jgi:hypothetical protein